MSKTVTEPRGTQPGPSHPIGSLLPRNAETSKLEEQVRARLIAAGVQLHDEQLGIQCGFDEARNMYPILTPDYLIPDSKVCIEIDPENTHVDRVDQDRGRNALLAAAGWRVVRLRLGGLEAIGDGDVVTDRSGATLAAVAALVEAIEDAVAGRPGVVRTVKEKPIEPRKKSRLGAIRENQYTYGVHDVRWTLDDGDVLNLAVVDNGRYLGRVMKSEFPRYVRPLDLRDVPKDGWRKALEPLFEGMEESEYEPVSTFPWGDSLFIGPQAGTIWMKNKFSPFGPGEVFTTNLEGLHEYNATAIQGADASVLVELHAGAIAIGWGIESVSLESGRRGEYQRVVLLREGFVA
jgi:hypothetical protein